MTNHELAKALMKQPEMPVKLYVWVDRYTGSLDDTDLSGAEYFEIQPQDILLMAGRKNESFISIDAVGHSGH